MRTVATLALTAALAIAVLGLAGCSSAGADADGQTLVLQKCVRCHTIDRVRAKKADRAAWDVSVTRMQAHGLVLSEDEKARILDFLSSGKAF